MKVQITHAERGLLSLAYREIMLCVREGAIDLAEQIMLDNYGLAPPDLSLHADMIDAPPWDEGEVASLAGYQHSAAGHPFTCGDGACRERTGGEPLVATAAGWTCPHCPYTQDWAWAFMTNWWWRTPGPWSLIVFTGLHGSIQPPGGNDSPRKAPPC